MLPQYIAAIERETGALVSRLVFNVRTFDDVIRAAQRMMRDAGISATQQGRAVTYRVYDIRDATIADIKAHFACFVSSGLITQADATERVTRWRARLEA